MDFVDVVCVECVCLSVSIYFFYTTFSYSQHASHTQRQSIEALLGGCCKQNNKYTRAVVEAKSRTCINITQDPCIHIKQ